MRRILTAAGAAAVIAAAGISTVGAQPTPPTRFFGSAQVGGTAATDGTTVTAMIGTNSCGAGTVTGGQYSVDVASTSTKPGCGTDGASVAFTIGSARASQTGAFQTGAFVSLNLTASQATATATATTAPTATATTRPPTATPTPSTTRTVVPTTTVAPTGTRPPTTAPVTATAQRPAAPPAAPAPQAPAQAPRLPSTGAAADSDAQGGWLLGALAGFAALAGGAGVIAYRRR
ncbi:MAG: hypothetical protein HYX51_01845 [Chloroflexi bacterium]|nr:hypothetical protein [Chloroflexota bacterium]